MDKPYIRKLETVDKFDVWEVDGMFIRNNLNREFTNFGQSFRFPFIPKHEFWIDKEGSPEETSYFVNHMIIEWNLMNQGLSYGDAIAKADREEKRERNKSSLMLKVQKELKSTKKEFPKELHVKKLGECPNVEIWVVNGELVRDLYFIDFTEGGHCFVYDFVPFCEVWLDNDLSAKEMDYVLLHELHERYLMSKGMPYLPAHHSSSCIEYKCRHNPELLKQCLKEEMAKNQTVLPQ